VPPGRSTFILTLPSCYGSSSVRANPGLLFQTTSGNPLTLTNILRRHLHPALKKLGYVNPSTGDHKAGSHAFRRFGNTYVKNETSRPKGLRDYWLGHAGNSMDDLYDMVKDNAVLRKKKAEEYGIGFEIPCSVSSSCTESRTECTENTAQTWLTGSSVS